MRDQNIGRPGRLQLGLEPGDEPARGVERRVERGAQRGPRIGARSLAHRLEVARLVAQVLNTRDEELARVPGEVAPRLREERRDHAQIRDHALLFR